MKALSQQSTTSNISPRRAPRQMLRRMWSRLKPVSAFEKAIAANSLIIVLETLAGWWITQHNPETYHYVIDTAFIAFAALLGVAVNFAMLRAAFAPLYSVLTTIRAVEHGDRDARAEAGSHDADALALARTFNAMLDRLVEARDEAAANIMRAHEDERRQVALELHDQTGQSLTALALHAEVIAQRLAGEQGAAIAQAHQQAERLRLLAQQTLAEVQALSRQLRPPLLDDLGLPAALRWLADDAHERLNVTAELRLRPTSHVRSASLTSARQPSEVETALFRIAQESLTNAVRHGQAHHIRMLLLRRPGRVTLLIADDGCGFTPTRDDTPQSKPRERRGIGIEGMRERARLLSGTLRLRSRPGAGCVVRASIPLAPSATDAAATSSESASQQTNTDQRIAPTSPRIEVNP